MSYGVITGLLFFWGSIAAYVAYINEDDNLLFSRCMAFLFVVLWSLAIICAGNIHHC